MNRSAFLQALTSSQHGTAVGWPLLPSRSAASYSDAPITWRAFTTFYIFFPVRSFGLDRAMVMVGLWKAGAHYSARWRSSRD